ncbi:MAG: hypothetical protein SGJ23_17395, partial [Alphaproteobacteria bacterium]|nr:hypothetical protein [Alphaproteobacteria bacterium]
ASAVRLKSSCVAAAASNAARASAGWSAAITPDTLEAQLVVVPGVIAADQPAEARAAFEAAAATHDDFSLTALAHAVGMAGSGVIGFALARGHLDAVAAFEAASLDDLWQLETWGEDHVARQRLDNLEAEFLALGRYFVALRA